MEFCCAYGRHIFSNDFMKGKKRSNFTLPVDMMKPGTPNECPAYIDTIEGVSRTQRDGPVNEIIFWILPVYHIVVLIAPWRNGSEMDRHLPFSRIACMY